MHDLACTHGWPLPASHTVAVLQRRLTLLSLLESRAIQANGSGLAAVRVPCSPASLVVARDATRVLGPAHGTTHNQFSRPLKPTMISDSELTPILPPAPSPPSGSSSRKLSGSGGLVLPFLSKNKKPQVSKDVFEATELDAHTVRYLIRVKVQRASIVCFCSSCWVCGFRRSVPCAVGEFERTEAAPCVPRHQPARRRQFPVLVTVP